MASQLYVFVLTGPRVGQTISFGNLHFENGVHAAVYSDLQLPGVKNILAANSAKLADDLTLEEREAHRNAVNAPGSAPEAKEPAEPARQGDGGVPRNPQASDAAVDGRAASDADAGRQGGAAPKQDSAHKPSVGVGAASGPPDKVTDGITLESTDPKLSAEEQAEFDRLLDEDRKATQKKPEEKTAEEIDLDDLV